MKVPPKSTANITPRLDTVQGGREALERELMWSIVLDGDRQRRVRLERMLTPAANDAAVMGLVGSPDHTEGDVSERE